MQSFLLSRDYTVQEKRLFVNLLFYSRWIFLAGPPLTETLQPKATMETTEMKVLRKIVGITKFDHNKNEDVRGKCGITGIVKWTEKRR